MMAFLIYLPTLAFMPHALYFLAIAYSFFRHWKMRREPLTQSLMSSCQMDFGIIGLIVAFSAVNYFTGYGVEGLADGKIPSFFLIPFTMFIALHIDKRDLQILVFLIFIESLFVFAEYLMGVSTFFSSLQRFREIGSDDLFYYNKPLGLSYNSSIVASKLFIAFLLLDLTGTRFIFKLFFQFVFLMAIFLTFNRTVFLSIGFYIALKHLWRFLHGRYSLVKWDAYLLLLFTGLLLVSFLTIQYWDDILLQLTRKTGFIELSGRDRIWKHYINFIGDNTLLGNHSLKYYFGPYHGHNSFIQLMATHGLIIAALYIYLILRNVRGKNAILIMATLSYCFFQYGIFWGISLMDVFFFFLLFRMRDVVPLVQGIHLADDSHGQSYHESEQ